MHFSSLHGAVSVLPFMQGVSMISSIRRRIISFVSIKANRSSLKIFCMVCYRFMISSTGERETTFIQGRDSDLLFLAHPPVIIYTSGNHSHIRTSGHYLMTSEREQ